MDLFGLQRIMMEMCNLIHLLKVSTVINKKKKSLEPGCVISLLPMVNKKAENLKGNTVISPCYHTCK